MTQSQIILIICFYLAALVIVIYFSRPMSKRTTGALSGGAVGSGMLLMLCHLGNVYGLWRASLPARPGMLTLFFIATAIACAPIYLVTWRVARRFGRRGLIVSIVVVSLLGMPRDYLIAMKYPGWIVFRPGIASILADAASYALIVILGHAVMRLVAGPSQADRLSRAP